MFLHVTPFSKDILKRYMDTDIIVFPIYYVVSVLVHYSGTDDSGSTFKTVTVYFELTDVNDNTPAFSAATLSASVADKSPQGNITSA